MNFFIRLSLTSLLVAWAVWPFFDEHTNDSLLGEFSSFPWPVTLLVILAFFGMVAFYCRTLQHCYQLIQEKNRKAKPSSVWYMFAIPFNFVEDFFIVIDLANSIEEEKKQNEALKDVKDAGMVSGIGWCIAQLLSFIPSMVGQIAGLVGLILVIYHWILIARINRKLLAQKSL